MKLNQKQVLALTITGVFVLAFLNSRSSNPSKKENVTSPIKVEQETVKNTAPSQNQQGTTASQNSEVPQNNQLPIMAPSYVPGANPPRIGPTPGIIGEIPEGYNPYAELTDMMKRRQAEAGNNNQEQNSGTPQRNLYFETLSQQLKDLQGETEKREVPDPGPTSAFVINPMAPAAIDAPPLGEPEQIPAEERRINAGFPPVDPYLDEDFVDPEFTDQQTEQMLDSQRIDDELIDQEIERILEEEGY